MLHSLLGLAGGGCAGQRGSAAYVGTAELLRGGFVCNSDAWVDIVQKVRYGFTDAKGKLEQLRSSGVPRLEMNNNVYQAMWGSTDWMVSRSSASFRFKWGSGVISWRSRIRPHSSDLVCIADGTRTA